MSSSDPLAVLPTELLALCVAFLDPPSLLRAAGTSRRWRTACGSRAAWTELYATCWRPLPPLSASVDVAVLQQMCVHRWREPRASDVCTRAEVVELPDSSELCIRNRGRCKPFDYSTIASIRGSQALTPLKSSEALGRCLCYFEGTFSGPGSIGIASISRPCEAIAYGGITDYHVGWAPLAYGYHSDDGYVYWNDGPSLLEGEKTAFGPTWMTSRPTKEQRGRDQTVTIGCGYLPDTNQLFFTMDGRHLGDVRVSVATGRQFAAAVSLHERQDSVRLNFGRSRFAFDVEAYLAAEVSCSK